MSKDVIVVSKVNETYLKIDAEPGLIYELKEYFTFAVPGAQFSPKYKMKIWDGKISLIDIRTRQLYSGLLPKLQEFCKSRDYELVIDDKIKPIPRGPVDIKSIYDFVQSLNIHSDGKPLTVRDYQLAAIFKGIVDQRQTFLSPTSSGKSLIIYCIIRYILEYTQESVLLIVPNIGLVKQMYSDFMDYSYHNGFDVAENTQTISEGATKVINSRLVISTWQSTFKESSNWFNQFGGIICDEVHLASAASIRGIMEKATDVFYRIGLTGTLSESKTHEFVIQGLFGKITKVSTTSKLIEQGHISDIEIKCLVLEYQDKEEQKLIKGADYAGELAYICSHQKRAKLITKLVINQQGNTLVLIQLLAHGDLLHKMILEELSAKGITNRKVFLINGDVDGADRDEMRHIVEKEDNAIVVATYGTLSTGTSIKRIHTIIAASPTKSLVRLLQSIGRGLRKGTGKDSFQWIDCVDDFSGGKKKKNFAYLHFIKRLEIYSDQQFKYKIIKIPV